MFRRFFIGLCAVFVACLSSFPMASYAESVQLSPIVHDEPQGGYIFTALAPLPSVLPDVQNTSNTPTPQKPSTQIVLKKK